MNHQRRTGEPSYLEPFVRTDRILVKEGEYFYRTRECDMIGPFATISEARYDLNMFVEVSEIEKEINAIVC